MAKNEPFQGKDGGVIVAVRQRPFLERELEAESVNVIETFNENIIVVDERPFPFDYCLGPEVSQEWLYNKLVKPQVERMLEGFGCTFFTCGQTGTGKTYTMGLHSESHDDDHASEGMVRRALHDVFMMRNFESEDLKRLISISFIEIYNEKVYDLFGENCAEPIAKAPKFVGGIKKELDTLEDAHIILKEASLKRHVRSTKMNLSSSRSHGIFTIHSTQHEGLSTRTSALHLVDLAGSEGVRRTGHKGVALTEGNHINRGLLCITKVLSALSNHDKLIPYRDGILSWVLKDSLNTKSYITLLACISPCREDVSETLSTLKFAQTAKAMKNNPQINMICNEINKRRSRTPKKSLVLARDFKTPKRLPPCIGPNRNAFSGHKQVTSFTTIKPAPYSEGKKAVKRPLMQHNTFCTPSKIKKPDEALKVNHSLQVAAPRPMKDLAELILRRSSANLFGRERNGVDAVQVVNDKLNVINDTMGSRFDLDMSTSTQIGVTAAPLQSCSPVVRQCMAALQPKLEEMISKLFDKTLLQMSQLQQSYMGPVTSASEMIQKLSDAFEDDYQEHQDCTVVPSTKAPETTQSISCPFVNDEQMVSSTPMVFKIPFPSSNIQFVTTKHNAAVVSSSFNQNENDTAVDSTNTNFLAHDLDATVVPKTTRRSCRVAKAAPQSTVQQSKRLIAIHGVDVHANGGNRRSTRLSVARSARSAIDKENVLPIKENVAKSNKTSKLAKINNILNASYMQETGLGERDRATAIKKHKAEILKLMNTGTLKELQLLPLIGAKTAYQIITHRTLNRGKFKTLSDLKELPPFAGKKWERFEAANHLF